MSSTDAPRRAVLDACVLVGVVRRELLFAAARGGRFQPLWSSRILEEWRATMVRDGGPGGVAAADGEIALARLAFADAEVVGWEAHEGPLRLPDWNDRHVLAAAIAGAAAEIVTDNLRDFPRRALAEHGIVALSADAFLYDWALAAPGAALAAARQASGLGPSDADAPELRARLKRARLPRFAKEAARLAAA